MKSSLCQNLMSITKITGCIVHALFKRNPKSHVISGYSPTNVSDETDVEEFYESFNQTVLYIP